MSNIGQERRKEQTEKKHLKYGKNTPCTSNAKYGREGGREGLNGEDGRRTMMETQKKKKSKIKIIDNQYGNTSQASTSHKHGRERGREEWNGEEKRGRLSESTQKQKKHHNQNGNTAHASTSSGKYGREEGREGWNGGEKRGRLSESKRENKPIKIIGKGIVKNRTHARGSSKRWKTSSSVVRRRAKGVSVKNESGERINECILSLLEQSVADRRNNGCFSSFAPTAAGQLIIRSNKQYTEDRPSARPPVVTAQEFSAVEEAFKTLPKLYRPPRYRIRYKDEKYGRLTRIYDDVKDGCKGPKFTWILANEVSSRSLSSMKRGPRLKTHCNCKDGCKNDCPCTQYNRYASLEDGRVAIKNYGHFDLHLYTCSPRCGCDPRSCSNRLEWNERKDELEIVRRAAIMGFEVRALRNFHPGAVVAEFLGVIKMKLTEAQEHYAFQQYSNTSSLFSEAAFGANIDLKSIDSMWIDPSTRGNVARFVTHSQFFNVVALRVYRYGSHIGCPRIFYIAVQTIPAGTFLKVDYGTDFLGIENCICDEKLCHDGRSLSKIGMRAHGELFDTGEEFSKQVLIAREEINKRRAANVEIEAIEDELDRTRRSDTTELDKKEKRRNKLKHTLNILQSIVNESKDEENNGEEVCKYEDGWKKWDWKKREWIMIERDATGSAIDVLEEAKKNQAKKEHEKKKLERNHKRIRNNINEPKEFNEPKDDIECITID